jgi:Holliday junction resolvase-like predicted endonuclease
MTNSKQIGDEFEMLVLKDLESRGFEFIVRNVHMKGTGCEVDFVAKNEHLVWHVEAKGGKAGYKKRPGAKRTDNVKKSIANAALIKALYPDTYYVSYFSARPKIKSYSREMIDLAIDKKIIDRVVYLEEQEFPA